MKRHEAVAQLLGKALEDEYHGVYAATNPTNSKDAYRICVGQAVYRGATFTADSEEQRIEFKNGSTIRFVHPSDTLKGRPIK